MKGFTGIIYLFVSLTIAVILVSSVVLPQIFTANQTACAYTNASGVCMDNRTWDAGAIALWSILGIVVVASLITIVATG